MTVSSGSSRSSRESGVESMTDMETVAEDLESKVVETEADIVSSVGKLEESDVPVPLEPEIDVETDSTKRNDIDSPFEVFNTVYV